MAPHNQPLKPEVLVPKLGEYLVEKGLINQSELQAALRIQKEKRKKMDFPPMLGEVLIQLEALDQNELDNAVTEQILQLRQVLEKTNQQLEIRVKERTKELEQALVKLEELNRVKNDFVSNISHELRTPLTHIKGYLELLYSNDLGPTTEEQIEALGVMRYATTRLESLIEDMILFSSTEKEKIMLNIETFDVIGLGKSVFQRALPKARKKDIQLLVSFTPDLPYVRADREKIGWVLMQLVDNAIKFTPQNGKVLLKGKTEGNFINMAVSDTGIGIPTTKKKEVFEPFHQLDNSSTRRYSGTGLGLALVKKIIEAHGSMIHLESVESKGTRIEFLLNTELNGRE